jgi:hypothetical protein
MIIGIRRVSTRLPRQFETAQGFTSVPKTFRHSFLRQNSTMADFKVVFTKDAAPRESNMHLSIHYFPQTSRYTLVTNNLPPSRRSLRTTPSPGSDPLTNLL